MDEATAETAALFNAFDNAMTDELNDLKQAISSPDLRESSGSLLTEMPPATEARSVRKKKCKEEVRF